MTIDPDLRKRMISLAQSITHNHGDAEDAVADVQEKLLSWTVASEAFVATCVRNRAIDYRRKRRREAGLPDDYPAPSPEPPDDTAQELEALRVALTLMPQDEREIIEAFFELSDGPPGESPTARATRVLDALFALYSTRPKPITRNALKMRLSRARARLDILIHLISMTDSTESLGHFNFLLWSGTVDADGLRHAIDKVAIHPDADQSLRAFLRLDDRLHQTFSSGARSVREALAVHRLSHDQDEALSRKHAADPCRKNPVAAAIEPKIDLKTLRYHLYQGHLALLNRPNDLSGRA